MRHLDVTGGGLDPHPQRLQRALADLAADHLPDGLRTDTPQGLGLAFLEFNAYHAISHKRRCNMPGWIPDSTSRFQQGLWGCSGGWRRALTEC